MGPSILGHMQFMKMSGGPHMARLSVDFQLVKRTLYKNFSIIGYHVTDAKTGTIRTFLKDVPNADNWNIKCTS
jgi:hypothetical protein